MRKEPEDLTAIGNNRLIDLAAEEPASFEPYLYDDDNQSQVSNRKFKLPEVIGILPIRNAVAYPGTITPLAIGRKKSKALINEIIPNETIIGLLTQRNPDIDKPDFDNLYPVGTAASVLKITKLPQGSIHIVVHSITRFRVIEQIATKPFLKARVRPLYVKIKMTKKLQALMVGIRRAANRVIALSPNVPEEASVMLENIEDPSALERFAKPNPLIDG